MKLTSYYILTDRDKMDVEVLTGKDALQKISNKSYVSSDYFKYINLPDWIIQNENIDSLSNENVSDKGIALKNIKKIICDYIGSLRNYVDIVVKSPFEFERYYVFSPDFHIDSGFVQEVSCIMESVIELKNEKVRKMEATPIAIQIIPDKWIRANDWINKE